MNLSETQAGTLTLDHQGAEHPDVRIRRVFPWTKPNEYLSVRNADGKELALIKHLDELPAETRALVARHLDANTVVPTIKRVISVTPIHSENRWHVETDRGERTFDVQEREDVRFVGEFRFAIKDSDGNIYELPDTRALDPASQKAVGFVL